MSLLFKYCYYERDDVALKHLAELFSRYSQGERQTAQQLIDYQLVRGGRVVLTDVNRPAKHDWPSPLAAIEFALKMKKQTYQVLIIGILSRVF